jgi:membrane-associated phospholipid phosphatase
MENSFIDKEIKKGTDFIFGIGYFSEIIMAFVVIIALHTNRLNTIVYMFFFLLSGYVNTLLKSFFQQSRPQKPIKFLYSEHFSRINADYGMPSGHSQNVFYSITYLFLTAKDGIYWLQLGLVIATLMVYERWTFHNHTLIQLFVGALFGIMLGWSVVTVRDAIIRR